MRPVDHALHTWIADNLIAGSQPEALITTLVNIDVVPLEAHDAVYAAENHPYIVAAKKTHNKLEKRDALLNTLDFYQRMDPAYTSITPAKLPSHADFIRDYYSKNRPGLFPGAAKHWAAMNWTPQSLVDRIGADTTVQIQQGRDTSKEYELQSTSFRRDSRFGDFIHRVENEVTNDCYLTANNFAIRSGPFQSLANDVSNLGDGYLDESLTPERMFLWIGPQGTITPLHHDKSNNIFIQVYGRKRFRLIPSMQVPYMYNHLGVFTSIDLLNPEPAKYPLYEKATIIDFVAEPGDFVFIPIGWWHHVVAETPSISLSFTNVPEVNLFHDYPAQG